MLLARRSAPGATLRAVAAAVFCASAIFAGHAQAEPAKQIRIGGTGAALGGMRLLANAFMSVHPGVLVTVLPSLGSSGGIKALLADKIDIAVSAGSPTDQQQGAQLVVWLYARTPLAFATRNDTSSSGLTMEQVRQAYSGSLPRWPDGTRMRIVMRPAVEANTKFLRSLSAGMNQAVEAALNQGHQVSVTDQDNATALEEIPGSLGLITLAQLLTEKRSIKLLTLDGLEATVEALRRGKYPHAKSFYAVTKSQPPPQAETFLGFIRSPEGQAILASSGHLASEAARTKGM